MFFVKGLQPQPITIVGAHLAGCAIRSPPCEKKNRSPWRKSWILRVTKFNRCRGAAAEWRRVLQKITSDRCVHVLDLGIVSSELQDEICKDCFCEI